MGQSILGDEEPGRNPSFPDIKTPVIEVRLYLHEDGHITNVTK